MQLYWLREHPGKPVMGNNKTVVSNTPVEEFVAGIDDEKKRRDSSEMIALMRKITGHEPRLWGSSLVGFGRDFFLTGFSPRKSAFTVYIMPGFERCAALLKKLGPHKTGKSCLYLKNLAAVDRGVLEEIIRDSVEYMREKYPGT
jgi:hypothetical protein